MADMERFERRFAASLDRLADEVPTDVDPQALTSAIAAAEAGRGWLRPLLGTRRLQLAPALQVALVLAAILALVFGMLALAPRLVRAPSEPMSHGTMTCARAASLAAAGPVTLECLAVLPDPRLAGDVVVSLREPAAADPSARFGSMTLDASGGRWAGELGTLQAPSGMVVGDAVLVGDGDAAGLILRLRLLSSDGLDWGLLGWLEEPR